MSDNEFILDASNSCVYRSKPGRPKQARIRWEAAEYRLTWDVQRFAGPHVLVNDPNGNYGVELEIFFATHQALPEQIDHYIKAAKIRATRISAPMTLRTTVKGVREMTADIPAGAYLVQNPDGEHYAMAADEFHLRYELDEE